MDLKGSLKTEWEIFLLIVGLVIFVSAIAWAIVILADRASKRARAKEHKLGRRITKQGLYETGKRL